MDRRRDHRRRPYAHRPSIRPHSQALQLLAAAADVVERPGRIDITELLSTYRRYRTIVEFGPQSNTPRPVGGEVIDLTSSDLSLPTARADAFSEVIDLTMPIVPSSSTRAIPAARREPSEVLTSPEVIEPHPLPNQAKRVRRKWCPVSWDSLLMYPAAPLCVPLKHRMQQMNFSEGVADMCGICQEKFPDGFCLPCQHLSAHYDCLTTWLRRQPTCILCRERIEKVYQVRRV